MTSRYRPTRCSTRSSSCTSSTTGPPPDHRGRPRRRTGAAGHAPRRHRRVQALPMPARRARHRQGLRPRPPAADHERLPRLIGRGDDGMKIGVQLPEVEWEMPFPEVVAMARLAEQVGFDSVWLGDHLLYDLAVGPRGPWEVWTSLAAIGRVDERIELGPLVASTSFHAPAMLAKMAATVDAISGRPADPRSRRRMEQARVHRVRLPVRQPRRPLRRGVHDHPHVAARRRDRLPRRRTTTSTSACCIPDRRVPAVRRCWSARSAHGCATHAAARRRVEHLVERVRQHRRRLRRREGHRRRAAGRDRSGGRRVRDVRGLRQAAGWDAAARWATTRRPSTAARGHRRASSADQLRALRAAGADAVQLVVDPIVPASIEWLGDVVANVR